MINIEIDGIWCPKCREMHPSLFWHNKYNDYLKDRKERYYKNLERFYKEKNLIPEFEDNLERLGLCETVEGKCVICRSLTNFKSIETGNYICCNECKDKEIKKEA